MQTLILIGFVGLLSGCVAGVDDQTGLALLREPIATLTDAVVAQDMGRIIPATRDVVAVYEAVSGR
jgi:hypothetical protein